MDFKTGKEGAIGASKFQKAQGKNGISLRGWATWALVKPGLTVARKSSEATPPRLVSISVCFKNTNQGEKKWTRVKSGVSRSQV